MSADTLEGAEEALRRLEAELADYRAIYQRRSDARDRAEEALREAECELDEVAGNIEDIEDEIAAAHEALDALRAGGAQ